MKSAQEVYNAKMVSTLEDAAKLLAKKRADYTDQNFIEAAKIAKILTGIDVTPHLVAACLIGIKMSRYGNLTSKNKKPKNESLHDTVIDMTNYIVLMERERQRSLDEKAKEKDTRKRNKSKTTSAVRPAAV